MCVGENKRHAMHNFIRDEIAKGRQAFIVYPLIFESEMTPNTCRRQP